MFTKKKEIHLTNTKRVNALLETTMNEAILSTYSNRVIQPPTPYMAAISCLSIHGYELDIQRMSIFEPRKQTYSVLTHGGQGKVEGLEGGGRGRWERVSMIQFDENIQSFDLKILFTSRYYYEIESIIFWERKLID